MRLLVIIEQRDRSAEFYIYDRKFESISFAHNSLEDVEYLRAIRQLGN